MRPTDAAESSRLCFLCPDQAPRFRRKCIGHPNKLKAAFAALSDDELEGELREDFAIYPAGLEVTAPTS
jgi:hypothetical protein